MSPLPKFPPPIVWVEVDGKLRVPQREELQAYIWAQWHSFIVPRETLQMLRTAGNGAADALKEYDQ